MADKNITVDVAVKTKGARESQQALKANREEIQKTTAAQNNAIASQDAYNKRDKAIYQGNLASAKSFSKLSQTIGAGSSGLVGAYATLAANIFAATAAFNALRSASQIDQLATALDYLGNAAGRNLGKLSEELQNVTDYGISAAEAMRSASFGASAGFSNEQLTNLAKVAKGASIALGRDLSDSFDRLVRGVAKLEPEILDELGIIVKLDKATTDYAASLGKSAQSLTAYERQQAFAIATTEQGLIKYGALADTIEANPYDKLAASINNFAVSFGRVLTVVNPAIEAISESFMSLSGVITIFAAQFLKQLAPGLYKVPGLFLSIANAASMSSEAFASSLGDVGTLSKGYRSLVDTLKTGSFSTEDFNNAQNALAGSITAHTRTITRHTNSQTKLDAALKAGTITQEQYDIETDRLTQKIKNQEIAIARLSAEQGRLNVLRQQSAVILARNAASDAITLISTGSVRQGFKDLYSSIINIVTASFKGSEGVQGFSRVLRGASGVGQAFAVAIAGAGAAVLRFLPYIGLVLTFGEPVWNWFKNKFLPESEFEKKQKLIKDLETSTMDFFSLVQRSSAQFEVSFPEEGPTRVKAAVQALIGTLRELEGVINNTFSTLEANIREQLVAQNQPRLDEIAESIARAQEDSAKFRKRMEEGVTSTQFGERRLALNAEIINALTRERLDILRNITLESEKQSRIVGAEVLREQRDQLLQPALESSFFKQVVDLQIPQLKITFPGLSDEAISDLATSSVTNDLIKLFEDTVSSAEKAGKAIETGTVSSNLLTYLEKASSAYTQIEELATQSNTALTALTERQKTKFSDYIQILEKGRVEIGGLSDSGKALFKSMGGDINFGSSLEIFREAENAILTTENTVKRLNAEAAKFRELNTADSIQKAIELENQGRQAEIKSIDKQIAALSLVKNTEAEINSLQEQRRTLEIENKAGLKDLLAIEEARSQEKKNQLDIDTKILSSTKAIVNANQSIARSQREIAALRDLGRKDTSLSAAEELSLFKDFKKERLALINTEFLLKLATIDIEYDLLDYKAQLLEEEQGYSTESLTQLRKSIGESKNLAIEAATKEANAALADLKLEGERLRRATIDAGKAASPGQATATTTIGPGGFDVEGYASNIKTAGENAMAGAREQYSNPETGELNPGITENFIKMKGAIAEANATAQPFFESLRSLGPDGQLAAAIGQGSLIIIDSFNTLASAGTTAADKIAAVGAVIGAIGQMQQASSQQSVAAIDKEIEAEKKRDGKSKESLAKIAALEKKKEQEKKKAFEQNKKMLMAQTVMSTAAAIMNVWADPSAGNIWTKIAFTALVAALGAAQLSTISSMSYQGGGGSGASASIPKAVERGERSNKVDVSQRPTGGELAYIQGARGMGTGANNFTPAFMGAKYRATGGYVVGEQGPELFLPDVPGTIVPSDETRQMSAPVNVTFSVSAIDASSFNDMLADQRGNIISLIREAANLSGEPFLESVNTTPMSPTQRTYYRKA